VHTGFDQPGILKQGPGEADMNRFGVLALLFLLGSIASLCQTFDNLRTTVYTAATKAQWPIEMNAYTTAQEPVTIDGLTSSLVPIRVNFMSAELHKNPLGRGSGLYPTEAPPSCGAKYYHDASGWHGSLTCHCQICSVPVDMPPTNP
jgi:hypothetical protein